MGMCICLGQDLVSLTLPAANASTTPHWLSEDTPNFLSDIPAVCNGMPSSSAGGGFHLEEWGILVHPSHKAYRGVLVRGPRLLELMSFCGLHQEVSLPVLATLKSTKWLVDCNRQAGDQQSSHSARDLGAPS